jgi:hypothetical protein
LKRNKTGAAIVFVLTLFLTGTFCPGGTFEIGGAFLGIFNVLEQSDSAGETPGRRQFDFAANIDFLWHVSRAVRVNIQLQGGAGEGSLGFTGSAVTVTDLNAAIDISPSVSLVIGSFDTPFGADTPRLTNNGDTSANPFILNTLLYSALAGTNVGTLNTLGIKGELTGRWGKLAAAVTNGTDETAFNPDGNFEAVIFAQTPLLLRSFTLGASYLYSDDRPASGTAGTGSALEGWILDGGLEWKDVFLVRGYYGRLTYGDDNPDSADGVRAWKLSAKYSWGTFHLACRLSQWQPDSLKKTPNVLVPDPGFNREGDSGWIYAAREVRRLQVGLGWTPKPNILVKAEYFYDRYDSAFSKNPVTQGFIMVCNVLLN